MSPPPISAQALALIGAFVKRPYPARGRPFGPGFDHFRQKAALMQNPTIALVVSILTLAAQLGRALGPDAAAGFFDDLFAGRIGPEAAAEKAAAALSTTLDVGILAAQLSALHGIILAADAEAAMDKAVTFDAVVIGDVVEMSDGSMRVSRAEFDRMMELIDAATAPDPSPALRALLSEKTEAGFAQLEQEAQASEEGPADGG